MDRLLFMDKTPDKKKLALGSNTCQCLHFVAYVKDLRGKTRYE